MRGKGRGRKRKAQTKKPYVSKGKHVNIRAPRGGYRAATQTNFETATRVLGRVLFSA